MGTSMGAHWRPTPPCRLYVSSHDEWTGCFEFEKQAPAPNEVALHIPPSTRGFLFGSFCVITSAAEEACGVASTGRQSSHSCGCGYCAHGVVRAVLLDRF